MMDKDRIKGSVKEVVGDVKQKAGKMTGDRKTEAQGASEKIEGKIQNAVGGLKDKIRETTR